MSQFRVVFGAVLLVNMEFIESSGFVCRGVVCYGLMMNSMRYRLG